MNLAVESIILNRKQRILFKEKILAHSISNREIQIADINNMKKELLYFTNKISTSCGYCNKDLDYHSETQTDMCLKKWSVKKKIEL